MSKQTWHPGIGMLARKEAQGSVARELTKSLCTPPINHPISAARNKAQTQKSSHTHVHLALVSRLPWKVLKGVEMQSFPTQTFFSLLLAGKKQKSPRTSGSHCSVTCQKKSARHRKKERTEINGVVRGDGAPPLSNGTGKNKPPKRNKLGFK